MLPFKHMEHSWHGSLSRQPTQAWHLGGAEPLGISITGLFAPTGLLLTGTELLLTSKELLLIGGPSLCGLNWSVPNVLIRKTTLSVFGLISVLVSSIVERFPSNDCLPVLGLASATWLLW